MNDVQKAVFPCTLVGIVLVFLVSRLMAAPQVVQASAGAGDSVLAAAAVVEEQEPSPTEIVEKTTQKAKAKAKATPTPKKIIVKTQIIKVDSNQQPQAAPAEADSQPAAQEAAPAEESKPEAGRSESSTSSGECSLSSSYPAGIQQWCGLIESAASQHNLEPNLIAAVMLQESGGDPNAYSGSGAVGLMQVMPSDGLAAQFICASGLPCFHNRPTMQELYDPAFNIEYGVRMLAGLINRNGSLRDGLLSYGPMGIGYSYADKILTILANYR